jgi:hypothetical protein
VKPLKWIWAITLCGAILPSNAQTNDWQTVQGIAPGSSISVTVFKHRGRRECELLRVSESDLACELERGHFSKRLVFLRDDIREVRLERPDNHHMIAGAVIGGAAGLAIGVLASARSVDPESRSADPAFGALLGTAIGAGVGRAIHQHGSVLYQRK